MQTSRSSIVAWAVWAVAVVVVVVVMLSSPNRVLYLFPVLLVIAGVTALVVFLGRKRRGPVDEYPGRS
jgi:hypothetical protein